MLLDPILDLKGRQIFQYHGIHNLSSIVTIDNEVSDWSLISGPRKTPSENLNGQMGCTENKDLAGDLSV
jgi:hypothetical protein